MASYTEPTQEEFDSAELQVKDILLGRYPSANTKKGSVLRELLIRPFAYAFSWIINGVEAFMTNSSVATLSASSNTDNEFADAVASNYFVTRKSATASSGVVTATCKDPSLTLSAGFRFSIGGYTALVPERILAGVDESPDVSGVLYIKMHKFGNKYTANIPVVLSELGAIEIEQGSEVVAESALPNTVEALDLTSAITGGVDTETDAELIERARISVVDAGVGSLNGIKRQLQGAPVTVTGVSLLTSESPLVQRARFNSLALPIAGVVDAYVRTQSQLSSTTIELKNPTTTTAAITYSVNAIGAFIPVSGVVCPQVINGTVSVTRRADNETDVYDIVIAGGTRTSSTEQATAVKMYMPGIEAVGDYINSDSVAYVGTNIRVDSAVPVTIKLECAAEADHTIEAEDLDSIHQSIANIINSMPVGSGTINFSDIRMKIESAYAGVKLRLPCVITGTFLQKDGTTESFATSDGIFDITTPVGENFYNWRLCFFSAPVANIEVTQVK